jgi:hypothetical protein
MPRMEKKCERLKWREERREGGGEGGREGGN